jgi:hypothetical protein
MDSELRNRIDALDASVGDVTLVLRHEQKKS